MSFVGRKKGKKEERKERKKGKKGKKKKNERKERKGRKEREEREEREERNERKERKGKKEMTGFSLDSAAGNETLLLILDVYFAQAFVTGHCHLIRCSLKKCYQAV